MRLAPLDRRHASVHAVRDTLTARPLDGLIVTSLPNVADLTGFFASAAALVITGDEVLLAGRQGRVARDFQMSLSVYFHKP